MKKSMSLKVQQTEALQQKNAIEFCKLLKDCGEYHKEEFDALVKTTFESIMKSHEGSGCSTSGTVTGISPDGPPVASVSTSALSSSRRRDTSNSDLSSGISSPNVSDSTRRSTSSSQRLNRAVAAGLNSDDDCSVDSTCERARELASQRTNPIVLEDDGSVNQEDPDDESDNSSPRCLTVLTQARI